MGEKVDKEIAEAASEYAKEMTLPELYETLEATQKTVEWLQSLIEEIQRYDPKQSSKRIGEGDG